MPSNTSAEVKSETQFLFLSFSLFSHTFSFLSLSLSFFSIHVEKIGLVRKERTTIMLFQEKKARSLSPQNTSNNNSNGNANNAAPKTLTAEEIRLAEEKKAAALLELEEKRMEALRRRQQDELNRIIDRERTLAETQVQYSTIQYNAYNTHIYIYKQ